MAKKPDPTPARSCADCFHFYACHLWAVSISTDVAPKCPQFEPARYATLKEMQDLYKMHNGEVAPVVHGRWKYRPPYESLACSYLCSACGYMTFIQSAYGYNYCPNCGAKMDATDNNVGHKDGGASNG